jgi:hypothetical protein
MVQPKQVRALAPTLAMLDLTQTTGSIVAFDTLRATATTTDDEDKHVTTGVDLYDDSGATFVASMLEGPAGTWTVTVAAVTEGAHNYIARRSFASGTTDSPVQSLTALGPLAPNEVTSATLLAWYRCPESIEMHTQLRGTNTVTIASASTLIGRTENVILIIQAGGLPGTGTFLSYIDGGGTPLEGAPVTIPTAPGTYTLPGTDLTVTFQQGVSYGAGTGYRGIVSKFLDKVGAYPNSTNNFINDGTSPSNDSRPRIAATNNSASTLGGINMLGATAVRFDPLLGQNGFMWCTAGSIATAFSGADVPFGFFMVVSVGQAHIPTVAGQKRCFYDVSNLTDADVPRISMNCQLAATAQTGLFNPQKVGDTGTNKNNVSGGGLFAEVYLLEDTFDGSLRKVVANAADQLGGDAGPPVDQSGLTITTTRFVIGQRQDQAGKNDAGTFDLGEFVIFDGPITDELELWQHRAYYLT